MLVRRFLLKLLVLVSICLLVSCASSDDEYEDDAEIENSNSEDVAMSDDSQEQGESNNDDDNNNEEVNNEFNNNNNDGQYADGENNGDEGWQESNNENLGLDDSQGGEETAVESTEEMVEDVNGGNPVDPVLNNGGASNQAVTETTEEVTEETQTQIPDNSSSAPVAEAPTYEVGSGVVKYVTQNTSVYGDKNSGFAVGSYEVGDHPLVINDDGTYATTSSGKVVPSSALTERAVPRPRKSIEYR